MFIVFWKETTFRLWRAMDRRWNRNVVSLLFSVTLLLLLLLLSRYFWRCIGRCESQFPEVFPAFESFTYFSRAWCQRMAVPNSGGSLAERTSRDFITLLQIMLFADFFLDFFVASLVPPTQYDHRKLPTTLSATTTSQLVEIQQAST